MIRKPYLACFLLAALFAFSACDDRQDPYFDINGMPSISIYKNGVLVESDLLQDSLKLGQNYVFDYSVSDEESLPLLNSVKEGNASVTVNGNSIIVTTLANGTCALEFFARDAFNKSDVFNLRLTTFSNLKPIARLTIKKIGLESPYEYEFDGSASFDKDKKFGGMITDYFFSLNNYVVNTQLNKIRYIFGSSGQKLIKFKVKDNNGEWSDEISEFIYLN